MSVDLIINVAVAAGMIAVVIYFGWSIRAIERTGNQRSALLDRIDVTADYASDALRVFGRVPYDAHRSAVFWRRDPRALYEDAAGLNPRLIAALAMIWPKEERA